MARSSLTSDLIGFLLGFFFGCCGLVLAVFWLRDQLRGVILGMMAQMLLGLLVESSTTVTRMPLDGAQPVPWELVAAFVIVTVFVFGTIAGAIWAFGGRGDDDDDDAPPPPPEPDAYVTFSRR